VTARDEAGVATGMSNGLVGGANFNRILREHGFGVLSRERTATLQVNVGKLCNQACHHCHVDAGPKRSERMTAEVAERVITLLARSEHVVTVDLTGGAPELNPNFRFLVEQARALGRRVMVRCNLTVLFVDGMEWLPQFYQHNQVELVCSLPCYSRDNVERQRGGGVFDKSIAALMMLNRLGYGTGDPKLTLNLVYNPVGAFLPPAQAALEASYKRELKQNFGIEFNHLFTITNMPINRFAAQLRRWGKEQEYMGLLVNHFNPTTVAGLMCRHLVSVGYDGKLYDCDFNQMLEMALRIRADGPGLTIWDIDNLGELDGAEIATGRHCFGCTAGAGSSCGGALA
jgi:radical SAM/Cys-rich protein